MNNLSFNVAIIWMFFALNFAESRTSCNVYDSSKLYDSSNLVHFGDVVKLRISTLNYSNFQILLPFNHDFRGTLYNDQMFVLKSQQKKFKPNSDQIHDQYLTFSSNLFMLVDQPTNWTLHRTPDTYKHMEFPLNYDDFFWFKIGSSYMSLVGHSLHLLDQPMQAWQIERL